MSINFNSDSFNTDSLFTSSDTDHTASALDENVELFNDALNSDTAGDACLCNRLGLKVAQHAMTHNAKNNIANNSPDSVIDNDSISSQAAIPNTRNIGIFTTPLPDAGNITWQDPFIPTPWSDPQLPNIWGDPQLPTAWADPILPNAGGVPSAPSPWSDPTLPSSGGDPTPPTAWADPMLPNINGDPSIPSKLPDPTLPDMNGNPVSLG